MHVRTPKRSPHDDAPAIELDDVCVAYGDTHVLDHVSVRIDDGEFVGIVGPNGGGKSTLLKAALGLIGSTCGEARLFGTPTKKFHAFERIGYVPQHAVHVESRFPATALEIAMLGRVGRRGLLRPLNATDKEATQHALAEVGVSHLASRRIGTLSGGERQRVFLAKALASEPEVLILDEPTTGVDPKARESFYRLLDHLNHDHGLTIILVSHDNQALSMVAHRLVAVNRTIVFDGSPQDFEARGGLGAAFDIHLHHGEVSS